MGRGCPIDAEDIRDYCLSLPHCVEKVQWDDDLTFRIGDKMFAVLCPEPSHQVMLCFKCEPETFSQLQERPGIRPAPYLARYQWVGLESLDALESQEIRDLIAMSYRLVLEKLPRKVRKALV